MADEELTEMDVLDQMIYSLCDGDITRRMEIENNYTEIDALEWALIRAKIASRARR